jgi:hypothetical protein
MIAFSLIMELLAQDNVVADTMRPSDNAQETSMFVGYMNIND